MGLIGPKDNLDVNGDKGVGPSNNNYGAALWARNKLDIIKDLAQDRTQWKNITSLRNPLNDSGLA